MGSWVSWRSLVLSMAVAACQGREAQRPAAVAPRAPLAPAYAPRVNHPAPEVAHEEVAGELLERFADALVEHRISELSLDANPEGACAPQPQATIWVVSGVTENGSDASCLLADTGVTCVAGASRDLERAMRRICGQERPKIPAPGWLNSLAAIVRSKPDLFWKVTPVAAPAGLPSLSVRNDLDDQFLLVRVSGRWWRWPEPLAWGRGRGFVRVLDASSLGPDAVFLVVADSYDGGSELGSGETTVHVFCNSPAGLAGCAEKRIGLFRWHLDAGDRHKYPRGAHSLRERPHIEAELEASLTRRGLLRLSLVYSKLPRDRSEWEPDPDCEGDAEPDEDCHPVSVIEGLINDVGPWRLEGGRFIPALGTERR